MLFNFCNDRIVVTMSTGHCGGSATITQTEANCYGVRDHPALAVQNDARTIASRLPPTKAGSLAEV